jgi:hypothetical protein
MGGQKSCGFLLASETLQQLQDQDAGGGVEIPRWFIGKKQPGGVHKCAGNGDALHLATGELVRVTVAESPEFYPAQTFLRCGAGPGYSSEQQWQLHIFVDRECMQKLKGLKDKADFVAAKFRQAGVVEVGRWHTIDEDHPRGREVHGAGEIQQGGFSTAASADQSHQFTHSYIERQTIEGANVLAIGGVFLSDILQREDGHRDSTTNRIFAGRGSAKFDFSRVFPSPR